MSTKHAMHTTTKFSIATHACDDIGYDSKEEFNLRKQCSTINQA